MTTSDNGPHQAIGPVLALLERWIMRSVEQESVTWFRDTLAFVRGDPDPRILARAVGFAPRKLGRADLVLAEVDRREADAARAGFDPTGWTLDQAGRVAFVLAGYRSDRSFVQMVETLWRTADLQELVAYYRGLAVFPAPDLLRARAGEGVRSGIRPIFEAVAHRNPYPREMFDEPAWNQLVLKALFIGSPLEPIQGLDERCNRDLAEILLDYAQERWAAGRSVSPELWRCVGPYAGDRGIGDIERALAEGTQENREAVLRALAASRSAEVRAIPARLGLRAG
jgi:hypothetical protein